MHNTRRILYGTVNIHVNIYIKYYIIQEQELIYMNYDDYVHVRTKYQGTLDV